jgi:XTP/dITP diphosphohydrolase
VKLLLGTKNQGKIREILSILGDLPNVDLLTHNERPFSEVPEMGETFLDNALLKARGVSEETGLPVLAEDSGLEVEALEGAPGVRSARFAGEDAADKENIEKLLALLKDVPDERRTARFVCVAVLRFPDGREIITEGELRGRIAKEPRGRHGFGYDPVFIPEGYDRTLGELGPAVKDRISHRRKALEKLREELLRVLRS